MIEIRVSGTNIAEVKNHLRDFLLTGESDLIKPPACEAEEHAAPKSPKVDPINEAPKAPKKTLFTLEEIRALLKRAREQAGADAVRALLKKHGVETVPALPESAYDDVVNEATDLITGGNA